MAFGIKRAGLLDYCYVQLSGSRIVRVAWRLDESCSRILTFFYRADRIQIVQIGALFCPPLRFVLIAAPLVTVS